MVYACWLAKPMIDIVDYYQSIIAPHVVASLYPNKLITVAIKLANASTLDVCNYWD